jgi:hypothetical protein
MHLKQTIEEKPIAMQDFDPHAQVNTLRKVLESITDPRRRQILGNLIEHATVEGGGRYHELMASCSRKRQSYNQWGISDGAAVVKAPQSYAELEIYYKSVIDSKIWMLHYDLDKVIVGDDEVLLDGVLHQLYPTNFMEPLFQFKADPRYRAYQMTKRLSIVFTFDEDGLSSGEHSYANGPITAKDLTPVEDQYLPELFKAA